MLNQNYPFDFVLRKSNPFILKNTSYTETPKHRNIDIQFIKTILIKKINKNKPHL